MGFIRGGKINSWKKGAHELDCAETGTSFQSEEKKIFEERGCWAAKRAIECTAEGYITPHKKKGPAQESAGKKLRGQHLDRKFPYPFLGLSASIWETPIVSRKKKKKRNFLHYP